MTLLFELKKELRKLEQTRKDLETKVAAVRQRENRLRQLAIEFGGAVVTSSAPVRRPLSEEHRRKISEALKRRHAKN